MSRRAVGSSHAARANGSTGWPFSDRVSSQVVWCQEDVGLVVVREGPDLFYVIPFQRGYDPKTFIEPLFPRIASIASCIRESVW